MYPNEGRETGGSVFFVSTNSWLVRLNHCKTVSVRPAIDLPLTCGSLVKEQHRPLESM
jgi:hypothetical protein